MDEPKFTPGTWSLNHESYGVHIEPSIAWIGFGTAHIETEHKANAALISAAPEMYEALEFSKRKFHDLHFKICCEYIESVLKKARGEE